jgi:hypothetical protein
MPNGAMYGPPATYRLPGTRHPTPVLPPTYDLPPTRHPTPDTWHLFFPPPTTYRLPGTRHPTPGTCSSPHLRPTGLPGTRHPTPGTCSSPHLPPTNYHSFQRHSRFRGLSTCVFIDIPALSGPFPQRSFVFNNIRASFRHFRKLQVFSCPVRGDILS